MDDLVVGRKVELARIDSFLTAVGSRSVALFFEGEPGIGKTTVWREAIHRAESRGFAVLSCRPVEAERKLSFAALADLLEGVPPAVFESLPGPLRRALEVALLQADAGDSPVDARAVGAGFRGILLRLAEGSPVLVAIDDTQWLDVPSASTLGFALRRLEGERVRLFGTRRPAARGARDRFEIAGADLITLEPLSLAAIHQLLKSRLGRSFSRPLLLRLDQTAGGNPFFGLEIGRELLHADVRPGDRLPVPRDLQRLLRRRLARLSAATREVLLPAAAVGEPTRVLLAAALGTDPSLALEEAERAGIIELVDDRVRFSHPLYAAAVYASAPAVGRRAAHQRLAEVVEEIEARARHLALGSVGPDAAVAQALDEAGELAQRRGAPSAAAELTALALERTPAADEERRQERVVDLVDHLVLAADAPRAWEVARRELPGLRGAKRRVHVLLALSELAQWSGDWDNRDEHPVSLAKEALEAAAGEASLAARCHAALAVRLEASAEQALSHAQRALELIAGGADVPRPVHADALCVSAQNALFRGRGLDIARVEQAIELQRVAPPRLVHDRSSFKLGQWLKYVDAFERSRQLLEDARQSAIDEGDDLSLVNILTHLVVLECWAGRWPVARTLGVEYAQRKSELSPEDPRPHTALVAALSGEVETVEALEGVPPLDGLYDVIRLRPLGLLALSQDDPQAAHTYYRRALELLERGGMREPAVFRIHADAVESAIGTGKIDEARLITRELQAHARRCRIGWNRMAAARSNACVAAAEGELERAGSEINRALTASRRVPMPFELGRTFFVNGQIERRAKRKSSAKRSLEQALRIFDELGARLWAERAQEELRRIGLRPGAPGQLTESERRVAELAASGLKNREVAAQLFMSPKTVEANLARAYRKLGIHSRAELGARLANVGRAPGQT